MERAEEAYVASSRLLDEVLAVDESSLVDEQHRAAHQLRQVALVIHNDLLRQLFFLTITPSGGPAKLLAMGDLAMKMIEARDWFWRHGDRALISLAVARGYPEKHVNAWLKELKRNTRLERIEAYRNMRKLVSAHYTAECIAALRAFGAMDTDPYFECMGSFSRFCICWIGALRGIAGLQPVEEWAKA